MTHSNLIAERIQSRAGARNRELATEALITAALGILFGAMTFALILWIAYLASWLVGTPFGLTQWQMALAITGIFLVTACISAWRRVDPLAGLAPLTDEQMMLALVGQATVGFFYVNPRRLSTGAAVAMLGGPSNIFEAFGIWAHRLRYDTMACQHAADLLTRCHSNCPADRVDHPTAALLLRRLALIKVVHREHAPMFDLTEKGRAVLSG